MGNACCVSASDRTLSNRTSCEDFHRNVRYSPSWSFRRDSRRRAAGEIDTILHQPCDEVDVSSTQLKAAFGFNGGNVSDGGTPPYNIVTPTSLKSPTYRGLTSSLTPSDASFRSNQYPAGHNSLESPEISEAVSLKLPSSLSSPSSFSISRIDPSSSHGQLFLPLGATPSRKARRSPGHQLFRQISDSRILGLKSPNSNSLSDGRTSLVLSASNFAHNLSVGSQGGGESPCDGWSLRTFSELVASSHRERWSFDSEHFGSGRCKIGGSSSRFSYSSSVDLRSCGACSKLLTERASLISDEVPVVAILVCGHAYHADCLENITPEASKYDPGCPVCISGDRQVTKMSRKDVKAEAEMKMKLHKKLKNRVMDSYFDNSEFGWKEANEGGEFSKTGASSSNTLTMSSFGKPFLKRRFSIGSKWMRSVSDNDSTKKRGFWGRRR